ncbi:hypothetical protein [Actinomadura sediminis]|uniref:Uncharacterized protein n=1 Tax=Actinomadura sediminis TaxID=1038904 RepID=A0ABW3EFD2_9ACTN
MIAKLGAPGRLASPAIWTEGLTLFNGSVIGFTLLVGVGIAWQTVLQQRRRDRLREHAAEYGWRPAAVDESTPGPVAEAARSRVARLAITTEQPYALWLVWHRWSESSAGNDTSSVRDLTRYFLLLDPGFPDVDVVRRTRLGGAFMPVRGAGTGDAAFDKRFLVRGPGEREVSRLLTDELREAMLADRVPAWEISGDVLITTYADAPTTATLQPRADTITDLARTLAGTAPRR